MASNLTDAVMICFSGKENRSYVSKSRLISCIKSYLKTVDEYHDADTITRRWRRLRQRGLIKYEVIDASKGKYKILEVKDV